MEAVFLDKVSGDEAPHEVSETATAGELLQEACRLFGREVLDSALEVDGAVVCTGVVGGVSGGEVSVGSLGVHSDSRLVLRRSRDRVLAVVAGFENSWFNPGEDSLPEWAWDDEVVALAAVAATAVEDSCSAFKFVSARLRHIDSFMRDVVPRYSGALRNASVELRADRHLVLAAITGDSGAMEYASNAMKADKEFVLAVVARYGYFLRHVSAELQADKQVVLTAVAVNGGSLAFAGESLQADKEVVMAAVVTVSTGAVHVSRLVRDGCCRTGWARA